MPQFTLAPGHGYSTVELALSDRSYLIQDREAAISPSGLLVAFTLPANRTELWTTAGSFVRVISPTGVNRSCGSGFELGSFIGDDMLLGYAGSCLVVADLEGVVRYSSFPARGVTDPETASSIDGNVIAFADASHLFVFRTSDNATAVLGLPVDQAGYADVGQVALAPGADIVAVVGSSSVYPSTKFYSVDFGNSTLRPIAAFAHDGRLLFSADGARALQALPRSGLPREMALYHFTGENITAEPLSCNRSMPAGALPLCPYDSELAAFSPDGLRFAWADELDVEWAQEGSNLSFTRAAVVHVLDLHDGNVTRGFQAGNATVGSSSLTYPPGAPGISVLAVRIFKNGTAGALCASTGQPLVVHYTMAEEDATVPHAAGSYV